MPSQATPISGAAVNPSDIMSPFSVVRHEKTVVVSPSTGLPQQSPTTRSANGRSPRIQSPQITTGSSSGTSRSVPAQPTVAKRPLSRIASAIHKSLEGARTFETHLLVPAGSIVPPKVGDVGDSSVPKEASDSDDAYYESIRQAKELLPQKDINVKKDQSPEIQNKNKKSKKVLAQKQRSAPAKTASKKATKVSPRRRR